jgi:hypothetical protein
MTDDLRAVASTSFVLRRWWSRKVRRYDDGTRVLEYESEPLGITRYVTRSKGRPREESYHACGKVCKSLDEAIGMIDRGNPEDHAALRAERTRGIERLSDGERFMLLFGHPLKQNAGVLAHADENPSEQ